jgi:hypothetical protein
MLIMRFLFLFIIVALLGFNNVSHSQNPGKTKDADNNKDKKEKVDEKTNSKVKEVVVVGVGDSSEDALKDAQRNAVNQVVGVLIDAKIMVENDKLIEDKILTFSNGFVKTSKVISQNKTGPLFKVKIEAVVEVTGIENILKKEKLMATGLVDGEGLLGESERKEEVIKNGAKMLREKMKDFPINVLDIQLNEKATKILKNEGGTSTVQYEITVKPNLEKYKVFSKQLVQILDKIAISKTEGTLEFTPAKNTISNEKKEKYIYGNNGYSNSKVYSLSSYIYTIHNKSLDVKNWQFALSTNRTLTGNSISYNVYTLDKKYIDEFTADMKIVNQLVKSGNIEMIDLNLKIRFLDFNGNEIISKIINAFVISGGELNLLFRHKNTQTIILNSVFLSPDTFETHSTRLILSRTIEIPNEDLKKVKKVEVTIE